MIPGGYGYLVGCGGYLVVADIWWIRIHVLSWFWRIPILANSISHMCTSAENINFLIMNFFKQCSSTDLNCVTNIYKYFCLHLAGKSTMYPYT